MVVAFLYRRSVLPEIGVLRPATSALLAQHSGIALDHLVLLPGERPDVVIPYALTDVVGSWVLVVGVTVSSLMLLRRVAGTIAMRRTLARCTPVRRVEEEGLVEAVERLAAAAGMRQAPRLLMLPEGTPGAFARGAGGGQILLSRDLMDDLDTEELEAILAHEIAHLQARDTVLTFVAGLARDLVAWNPIAYLALRHLIVDRELEADRRAAELTGKPLAVASGLVKICDLLRRRGPHALRPSVLVGFGVLRRPIGRRVTRLLALAEGGVPAPAGANTWVPFLAAAGLAVALALQAGLTLARNDEALAVMWGTSDAHNPERVWSPPQTGAKGRLLPGATAAAATTRRGSGKTPRAPIRPRVYYQELKSAEAVAERDLGIWMKTVRRLAPPRVVPWDAHGWDVRPIFSSTEGTFGVYKLEQRPLSSRGAL